MFDERTDGLLRGSRTGRVEQMLAMQEKEWTLDTVLELHCGLLDHGHQVREAAMDALLDLAKRNPGPVNITPARLLRYFMHTFTASSGIAVEVVQCLANLKSAETDEILTELVESGDGSNEQFSRWLTVLAAERPTILRAASAARLSPKRRTLLNHALHPPTPSGS